MKIKFLKTCGLRLVCPDGTIDDDLFMVGVVCHCEVVKQGCIADITFKDGSRAIGVDQEVFEEVK